MSRAVAERKRGPAKNRGRAARPASVEVGIDPALVEELRVLIDARTMSEAVRRAVVDALSRARAVAPPSVVSRARAASAARGAA